MNMWGLSEVITPVHGSLVSRRLVASTIRGVFVYDAIEIWRTVWNVEEGR